MEPLSQLGRLAMQSELWSDEPIKSRTDDAFGRVRYADEAANLIAKSHSRDSSVVFGLTGQWGSGKSSLAEMVAESLVEKHPGWEVVRFTPWATSDVAGLLNEFYSCLIQTLPRRRRASRRARRALAALAQISSPAVGIIPHVGKPVADLLKLAGQWLTNPVSWDRAFEKATNRLRDLGVPILVIADDIDRLEAADLRALLKVVRLLGRFPGVHYLLAYDERTLSSILGLGGAEASTGSVERFMEKIVQYPLIVPPLLEHQKLTMLGEGLSGALELAGRKQVDQTGLTKLGRLFPSHLWTPRGIDRYLAQVRHHLPMVEPGEIDDVDVILLALLRVAFPGIFGELPRWRYQLLAGHAREFDVSGGKVQHKAVDWAGLLAHAPEASRDEARRLLVALFPKVGDKNEAGIGWGRVMRISDEDYFDRYFAMGIPAHDVPDRAIGEALRNVAKGHPAALRAFLLDSDREKVFLAISKGSDRTASLGDRSGHLDLVRVLAGCVDEMADLSMFILEPRSRVRLWMARLLVELEPDLQPRTIEFALQPANLATRLLVWKDVEELVVPGREPAWLVPTRETFVKQATAQFMAHLIAGDGAPEEEEAGTYRWFAMAAGNPSVLRDLVHGAVARRETSVGDVAARMVSLTTHSELNAWWIGEFDYEAWAKLAPAADDPWYALTEVRDIDLSVTTWVNRKRYAQGRAARPVPSSAAGD